VHRVGEIAIDFVGDDAQFHTATVLPVLADS
jgi:hypothetical protein